MTHLNFAQPSAKPKAWKRSLPDTATGKVGREAVDRPVDSTDAEGFDPDETPAMPRPALRIEERDAEGNR